MTRIFVYEWCCSGAAHGNIPWAASLWAEGWAMFAAVMDDLQRAGGYEFLAILNAELRNRPVVRAKLATWTRAKVVWVAGNESSVFRALAESADFALVIAPETDRILETRCRWAAESGATLLGPPPNVVAFVSDKLALAKHLATRHVATPPTTLAENVLLDFPGPQVIKLRRGAGSQRMMVIPAGTRSHDFNLTTAVYGEMIAQPLISGFPASISFLIGLKQVLALPPTEQFVSARDNFRYLGGRAPIDPPLAARATRIAQQAIEAIPNLRGYVGVDVVLGSADDGSTDHVIEINPRVTTSYIGLRQMTDGNLMELLVRLMQGNSIRQPHWQSEPVTWSP